MPSPPQGVHLAQGYGPDSMAVLWTSTDKDSVVRWGTADDSLTNTAEATITEFKADILANKRKWYISNATMTGLTPSAKYFYQVGDGSSTGWSKIFNFKATVDITTINNASEPQLHVIFGDMGSSYAFSLCPACNSSELCDCKNNDTTRGVNHNYTIALHSPLIET
jgi:hypothetical protein